MNIRTRLGSVRQRMKSRRAKWLALAIGLLIGVIGGFVIFGGNEPEEMAAEDKLPVVRLGTVGSLAAESEFETVGTIEAVSEAQLKAENGGQVIAVNTELGRFVPAGTVVAQLENSRERAALTQAQGSYQAAVAGAAQSESGERNAEIAVSSAEDAHTTAIRNGFATVSGSLLTTLDQFFANPNSFVPGVRIDGNTSFLNSERVAFQTLLPELQVAASAANARTNELVGAELRSAITREVAMIDSILTSLTRDPDQLVMGVKGETYIDGLIAARTALVNAASAITAAERGVQSAEQALAQAKIAATSGQVSLADAQITVALGALRAAQANYEKTLVRTPIAGTVNALYVKRGDYVSPLQDVAIVANNSGLQIITGVSEAERAAIEIGDTVSINDVATGTVTAIAGAVDPTTGKVAVKASVPATNGLQNGMTATIKFLKEAAVNTEDVPLTVPLTAVKLNASDANVFVVENGILVAKTVTLGPVSGESVVVTSGLTPNTTIVIDARGLKNGEAVSIVTE